MVPQVSFSRGTSRVHGSAVPQAKRKRRSGLPAMYKTIARKPPPYSALLCVRAILDGGLLASRNGSGMKPSWTNSNLRATGATLGAQMNGTKKRVSGANNLNMPLAEPREQHSLHKQTTTAMLVMCLNKGRIGFMVICGGGPHGREAGVWPTSLPAGACCVCCMGLSRSVRVAPSGGSTIARTADTYRFTESN